MMFFSKSSWNEMYYTSAITETNYLYLENITNELKCSGLFPNEGLSLKMSSYIFQVVWHCNSSSTVYCLSLETDIHKMNWTLSFSLLQWYLLYLDIKSMEGHSIIAAWPRHSPPRQVYCDISALQRYHRVLYTGI
jgi:hypothetical protein